MENNNESSGYRERIYTSYGKHCQDAPDNFDYDASLRWGKSRRYHLRGWLPESKTARLVDDLDRPDPQDMTHAAIIRRANMDDRFFYQLVAADDGYGMMGDTD